jgi:hypothetical protein
MKYLGIWANEKPSFSELDRLNKLGINSIFLSMGWFWDEAEEEMKGLPYPEIQVYATNLLKTYYWECKTRGFQKFLVDAGWGLGKLDGNNFYQKVIVAFDSAPDVMFYLGEPWETFIEQRHELPSGRKMNFEDVAVVLFDRISCGDKFVFDATVRNINLLRDWADAVERNEPGITISSYFRQEKHWVEGMPFVWIMGQFPKWHSFNSLNYWRLNRKANESGIEMGFLYQGDKPDNSIHGIFMKPLVWLGLFKPMMRFCRWFFVKVFGRL